MKLKKPKKSYAEKRLANPSFGSARRELPPVRTERIVGCALTNEDGTFGLDEASKSPYHSHADIRRMLKYENPYKEKRGDSHLFVTSTGRLVSRWEGAKIAGEAGQCTNPLGRELLSSDIITW